MSTGLYPESVSLRGKSNSLRPMNRPNSAGNSSSSSNGLKSKRKSSPLQKISNMFKRDRNAEDPGHIPVRPSCFADDDRFQRRSESPDGSSGKKRASSIGTTFKVNKKTVGKEGRRHALWRPRHSKGRRLEWESDSGRTLTLEDVPVNELSKVEVEALQRVAVAKLQEMDIPVSFGVIKGSRNKNQRLSFNSFKQKKVPSEKPKKLQPAAEDSPAPGIFGQPLNKVVTNDSACNTPGSLTPVVSNSKIPSVTTSPTSTSSSEISFVDSEANATALLLEALSHSTMPSPKAQRRQSLCRNDPQVPSLVKKAIHYLDTRGVKTEGIFRVPGAKTRIDEIRERFDSGQDVELTDDLNPHDVACLLKEFFRSLPEPLLTRELFPAYIATRKLSSSAQRRDALRYLCLLLPQANRDTLQELLQFLSRVALHSNGIILIDGTEEVGNRMTEQNLALIIGPNVLHRETKRKSSKSDYQVIKQDPEELNQVCKVMEDLIRLHLTIFNIPAHLYDFTIKALMNSDPDAVDQLLKRKCIEQGLSLDDELGLGPVSRSRSTEALAFRKVSLASNDSAPSVLLAPPPPAGDFAWRRSRSLSDTQEVLDDAIRNLEQYLDEELTLSRQRHYSSNDSAVCESETVLSPLRSECPSSEPTTLIRKRQVFESMDSAFSNNSSPTNSSEGMNNSDILSLESDSPFIINNHTRMSSGISGLSGYSGISSVSPTPGCDSPEPVASPQLGRKGPLSSNSSSLERNHSPIKEPSSSSSSSSVSHMTAKPHPPTPATPEVVVVEGGEGRTPDSSMGPRRGNQSTSGKKQQKWDLSTLPGIASSGTYDGLNRSPILGGKDRLFCSEQNLGTTTTAASPSDNTPTDSTSNCDITKALSSVDCPPRDVSYENDTII